MAEEPLQPGFRLGKYEVQAHIATGGMASVYKAMDVELRRVVALKVLDPGRATRTESRERFKREARSAARLSYKHIVTLYEASEQDGFLYLAMEFIEGIDLEYHIRRNKRLGAEETRRLLVQATKALDHAHRQGIVHRDIKPSNFLLAIEDDKLVVKLTDLGLAQIADEDNFRVTRAGHTVGTVDYMSPEQAKDSSATDIRSDIYSLGCTAYHMLAGQPPFADGGLGERIYRHMEEPPPDLLQIRPDVSPRMWRVIQRMLAKRPEDRYQTPAEVLADLKTTHAEAAKAPVGAEPVELLALAKASRLTPEEEAAKVLFEDPPTPREPSTSESPTRPEAASDDKKKTVLAHEPTPTSPEGSAATITIEQTRAAAGQFERARRLMEEEGDREYTRQLLFSCCKLDPPNLTYRAALRQFVLANQPGLLGRWLGSLGGLALATRVKSARRSGDHRKVLEQGEELLARQPDDVSTHLQMAESAEALGFHDLSLWLLEQGLKQAPKSVDLMRAVALRLEKDNQLSKAIALWQMVRKAVPEDIEAPRKINALSVSQHISKGNYRVETEPGRSSSRRKEQ